MRNDTARKPRATADPVITISTVFGGKQTDSEAFIDLIAKKAAIYCCLSKDDDIATRESASIGNQRYLLFRYCDKQGFRVCGVYQDNGFSDLSMDRPDLQKLLADVKKGNFDVVLTKDLSRLSRNYLHTGNLIVEYFPRCHRLKRRK